MSRELLDYDIDTGVAYYTEQVDDTTTVSTQLDAGPMIEQNKLLRNEGVHDLPASAGFHKYCDMDDVLMLALLKKGINVNRMDQWSEADRRRFFMEIETNYPYYKVTNKKAWRAS
jgi:hypothetical protein